MPSVNSELTFGLEIEATQLAQSWQATCQRYGLQRVADSSIINEDGQVVGKTIGGEIITPVLSGTCMAQEDGRNLSINVDAIHRQIAEAACTVAASVNSSCGVHIHLGKPSKTDRNKSQWKPEEVRTFLVIGQLIEDRLFAVCPPSRKDSLHCKRILDCYSRDDLVSYYPVGDVKPNKRQNPKRYCWLNLIETKRVGEKPDRRFGAGPALGTVEIRMLGNTRRFDYIWQWTQLWMKIAALVAYVPASLAIMHCMPGNSLDADFEALATLKRMGLNENQPMIAHQHQPIE